MFHLSRLVYCSELTFSRDDGSFGSSFEPALKSLITSLPSPLLTVVCFPDWLISWAGLRSTVRGTNIVLSSTYLDWPSQEATPTTWIAMASRTIRFVCTRCRALRRVPLQSVKSRHLAPLVLLKSQPEAFCGLGQPRFLVGSFSLCVRKPAQSCL